MSSSPEAPTKKRNTWFVWTRQSVDGLQQIENVLPLSTPEAQK